MEQDHKPPESEPRRRYFYVFFELLVGIALLPFAVLIGGLYGGGFFGSLVISLLVAGFGGSLMGVAFHWRSGRWMFLWMAAEAALLALLLVFVGFVWLGIACAGSTECI